MATNGEQLFIGFQRVLPEIRFILAPVVVVQRGVDADHSRYGQFAIARCLQGYRSSHGVPHEHELLEIESLDHFD